VPSPVPKYTKMAIHRDSPMYNDFSILGHRASPVYSLNQQKMADDEDAFAFINIYVGPLIF